MKKLLIIQLLSAIFLLAGCGGNDIQNKQREGMAIDTVPTKSEEGKVEDENESSGKLELNNGSKWQANVETKEGIQKMMSVVTNHLNKGNTENKTLSEDLEKEFTAILQKCTMTGESHKQLHNFLLPLREKIVQLKDNQTKEAVKDIQSYLENFYYYFQ